jgi:hypothetical protein
VNLDIPEVAGNAARLQNIYSYSPTVGSNNNIQVDVAIPMSSSNTYPSTDLLQTGFPQYPYQNTNIFHSPQRRNHTQGSTDFVPAGNFAIGSYFPTLHSQQKYALSHHYE